MSSIRSLVENKNKLDYKELTLSLVQEFGIKDKVEWDSVIPSQVQKDLFGGETLRLFKDHESFANQKDIRAIHRSKGETSQLLILSAILNDEKLSKQTIVRITKKFVGGQSAERYVVWFLGNPQHSAYKVVLSGREGKKVVLKTLPFAVDQPYYKTYDFILNEVSGKVNRFFVEPNELWKALWEAFDISVVNKQFYNDIKISFTDLVENVLAKSFIKEIDIKKHFAIRLIGRIIFSWFLKKKGIISNDVLSSTVVNKYTNYYKELLEKLFFDVFNTPLIDRKKTLPDEIKNYPFLNGGLFEDQKDDFKDNYQLFLTNEWFYNLFNNTLEKYNFTIDENSSSNAEIAIDPEMLGRIFENLLAEQNPETQESARKATGSYYTPREIVDYMVEQSLIEYLKSNVIANETKQSIEHSIEDFIHTEEFPEDLKPYSKEILTKLNSIKILDPACGSGAFPIGMLQKLITIKQSILSSLSKGVTSTSKEDIYNLKLQTILNSIYGCDIQPMAVELSRLRCWLSLIIDELVDKKKVNWGIANLPNLDFKFVCVNTLISLPEFSASFGISEEEFNKLKILREEYFTASAKRKEEIENEFKKAQKEIAEKHNEWARKDSQSVHLLINWDPFEISKTSWFDPFWMFGIKDEFDVVIANPPYIGQKGFNHLFREVKKSPLGKYHQRRMDYFYFFFHAGLNFLHKEGILALITTNYFFTATYADKLRDDIKRRAVFSKIINFNELKIFEAALGQHNAISILLKKNSPDFICQTIYAQESAFASSNILNQIFQKNYQNAIYSSKSNSSLFDPVNGNVYISSTDNSNDITESLLNKIYKDALPITNFCSFTEGIHTGADKVSKNHIKKFKIDLPLGKGIYVLSKEELSSLKLNREEKEMVKPWFKNSDIQKWTANEITDKYVIYYNSNYNYNNVVNIKAYLEQFKIILINRKVRSGTGFVSEKDYENFVKGEKYISYIMNHSAFKRGDYYCVSYPREEMVFQGEKIIVPQRSYTNKFAYNNSSWFASADVYFIKSINAKVSLKYVLSILNSKLYLYLLREKGKKKGEMLELYIRPLSQLQIKVSSNSKSFIKIVDQILNIRKSIPDAKIKGLEDQIDIMVYKLYDLAYDEVKIIDPDIGKIISKEEYGKFVIE